MDFRYIAHRGASAFAPENTRAAFIKAAELGASWVEFDVMLSADGACVVFHDETLERTTNGQGRVDTLSLSELQNLDAGSWFALRFAEQRILSLEQALDLAAALKLNVNLEIKPSRPELEIATSETIHTILQQRQTPHQHLIISSFAWTCLRYLCEQQTPYCLAILMHDWQENVFAMASELNITRINISDHLATHGNIQALLDHNFDIMVYTVNDVSRIQQLRQLQINGVFSDAIYHD